MPEDIEQRVQQLRETAAKLSRDRIKAEQDVALAEARRAAVLQALADEFSVSAPEAAEALLQQTEADLAAECARAEAALAEAGGEAGARVD